MAANNCKYLSYLNKLSIIPSIILLIKNLFMLIILLRLKKFESNPETLKFKVNDRVRITKYKNIFSKGYTENLSREMFIMDSVLKTKPWSCKIKDLKREKIIGGFYKKYLLLSIS